MKSTKDYPDEVINFMRNHPAMNNAVYPVHKRPLVVRTKVDYEFTTIAVDQVTAADGNYEVLFLGTGERFCWLHLMEIITFNIFDLTLCLFGGSLLYPEKWSQSEPMNSLISQPAEQLVSAAIVCHEQKSILPFHAAVETYSVKGFMAGSVHTRTFVPEWTG